MNTIFSFGEKIPEYDMKVLNEREVRASAGILFLFAMISFLNSWLIGNFVVTKAFVVIFLVDFSIRVLINPKYAPTLIIGRFFVRHQKVEYVGAPQKRFAWSIGLVLASIMFYLIVLNNLIGPFNLLVCIICLTLLFFEAAFGICLGCKIYNLFHKQKAQLCPGNVCEVNEREAIQRINVVQTTLVALFLGLIYSVANSALINGTESNDQGSAQTNAAQTDNSDCQAPDWAIKIGHEEKWKLHNGCKSTESKANKVTKTAAVSAPITENPPASEKKVDENCIAPDWAIKIGHEEKWKLHNGCKDSKPKTEATKATTTSTPATENLVIAEEKNATAIPAPAIEKVTPAVTTPTTEAKKDCIVPDWAIKMGHEEMWKQHNCQ